MTTSMSTEPVKTFSFGGGVQSTAALVMAASGELDYRTFLMANVGDDSEHPGTLRYLEQYAIPYAEAHGIELVVLDRVMKRTGTVRTLYEDLTREGSRSLKIPVRMSNGAPGTRLVHDLTPAKDGHEQLARASAHPPGPAGPHRRPARARVRCGRRNRRRGGLLRAAADRGPVHGRNHARGHRAGHLIVR